MSMLYEVMLHVRKRTENCWIDPAHCQFDTEFKIENGSITLPDLVKGQYFIIRNSYFNDGVYTYPENDLIDEESRFDIISIKPPKVFVDLVEEIEEWQETYGSKSEKPFTSESFDGYSYQRATNSEGTAVTWKDVFKTRLNEWRML